MLTTWTDVGHYATASVAELLAKSLPKTTVQIERFLIVWVIIMVNEILNLDLNHENLSIAFNSKE